MAILKLGFTDKDKAGAAKDLVKLFHQGMAGNLKQKAEFRDNGKWFEIKDLNDEQIRDFQNKGVSSNEPIREVQTFLHQTGFMPHNEPTGIFDYVTLSAVRLFQEYVRTIEGDTSIGKPDGIIGTNTFKHINRWKQNKLKCEWANPNSQPSDEYRKWIQLMNAAKTHFLNNPSPVLEKVNSFPKKTDTFKIEDWSFDPNEIHFLGIRTKQDATAQRRENDDLFVLLINGMVFKFWGSTDPSASMAGRSDEAFLVEGQHLYRFGWHKISSEAKIYKALRPATNGVLVFRDRDNDNKLTDADISRGLDGPNATINIHWSGIGRTNFSAGCQVIAGQSYINNRNEVVDCSAFASTSYAGLQKGKTRGAYNFIGDLVFALAPKGVDTIRYTLGRDENLSVPGGFGQDFVQNELKRMK